MKVVHNPGSIPSDDRLFAGADLIVVFEGPYAEYSSSAKLRNALQQLPSGNINNYGRDNFAYIVSAVPSNWSSDTLGNLIHEIEGGGKYIFITSDDIAVENLYATFGSDWTEFVSLISER